MKYFTVGPIEMDEETLNIASKQLPYFRNEKFSNLMLDNEKLIKESLNSRENDKVVFLTGSGTAAMDAVVSQTLKDKKALVVNGGTFGQRFVDLCEFYNVDYDVVNVDFLEDLTINHFQNFNMLSYDILLVNMHETSCGKLYDMHMLGDICKANDIKLVVDAISSYLCDEIDMQAMNIDCLITSSHKALGLEPGIAIVVFSEDYINNDLDKNQKASYYLDFNSHLKNMERGQTPFTPAVGVCVQMNEKLNRIKNEDVIKDKHNKAEYFRSKITTKVLPYKYSNALTPLYFENGGAKKVYDSLLNKGFCLNPCGGALSDKMLRVSHMGALDYKDIDELLKAINEVI